MLREQSLPGILFSKIFGVHAQGAGNRQALQSCRWGDADRADGERLSVCCRANRLKDVEAAQPWVGSSRCRRRLRARKCVWRFRRRSTGLRPTEVRRHRLIRVGDAARGWMRRSLACRLVVRIDPARSCPEARRALRRWRSRQRFGRRPANCRFRHAGTLDLDRFWSLLVRGHARLASRAAARPSGPSLDRMVDSTGTCGFSEMVLLRVRQTGGLQFKEIREH